MKTSIYVLIFFQFLGTILAASFFGSSYIAVPFQEAKKTTEIFFRLKTYRSDAILLLAAGQTDYCLVVLEEGALKVRINLGAGEFEVASTPRLRLDDLLWHDVEIRRKTSDVTLTIDGIHVSRQTFTGRFHELNINHGLFVGGLGDFTDLFLGLLQSFRGCMNDVKYNGMDILAEAKKPSSDVYGVEWTCASEFDAQVDSAISFVKKNSFMAFDRPFDRSGGSIQFDLKTMSRDALLLYMSGPPSKSDFISLELVDKKLRLNVDKGRGSTGINSSLVVSDGKWHRVEAKFSPTNIEVTMDDLIESKSIMEIESKYLDLAGYLYIGGIDVNRIARALQQGSSNANKNLAGCIRGLRVNGRFYGIRDPKVTMGITNNCKWGYPCLEQPCVQNASCVQDGINGFRCNCREKACVKPNYASSYTVSTQSAIPSDIEILSLTPIRVQEGGQSLITIDNLQISLEYEKYGMRESGIIFHVIEPPKHGKLVVDVWTRGKNEAFTMLDIIHDKVIYSHDGSEMPSDYIRLQMKLITQKGYILPSYLQAEHYFSLPVTILSVNDPPMIHLPPGRVLRIPKNSKEALTNYLFNVTDPDSPPSVLRYNILTLRDGSLESKSHPGKHIFSFTQEDINLGLLSYRHSGSSDAQMIYKVSDGIADSSNAILRIAAFDLQVHLVNNTGLKLAHNTKSFITMSNLSCNTNALHKNVDIGYKITTPPRYGILQSLRGAKKWHTVTHFTQRQIDKFKLRYEHTTKKPQSDEFRFRIIVGEKEFSMEYTFSISFVALTVQVVKNSPLLIDRITESFITESFLRAVTKPSQASSSDIIYTIVSTPHYGSIFLSSNNLTKHARLRSSSNFTQDDIAKGRVKYKLHHRTYSQFHDAFEYLVSSKGQSSRIQIFNIRYKPPSIDSPIFVNDLDVSEGGKEKISENQIGSVKNNLTSLIYNVTSSPKHGVLFLSNAVPFNVDKSISQFTSEDIHGEKLYYKHDDSETTQDNFYFVAFSEDPKLDFQFVGMMSFNIILQNDNPPQRMLEKVLNVVTNSERIVTAKDLMYRDPDLHTPPENIRYSREKINTGEFYLSNNRTHPVYAFTQKEINDKKLLFKHHGDIYSKAFITVTDGELEAAGVIEIVASEPFIEVFNNTGIVVANGGKTVLNNYNLSVETNLNAWGKSIYYKVTQLPKHGFLSVQGQKRANHFTEYDLELSEVIYHHNGKSGSKDSIRFRAHIGEITTEGILDINIYPESYWEELLIISNNTLHVEDSAETFLDQSFLHIMHPEVPPNKIMYYVTQQPRQGRLELESNNEISNAIPYDEYSISVDPNYEDYYFVTEELVFSQETIDEGRLKYVHTTSNLTDDYFLFDATNGISSLKGLQFNINVIPKTVYVSAGALVLDEGKTALLSTSLIRILSPYYRDRLNQLIVTDFPQHGYLERTTERGKKVESFSPEEMERGLVQYVHDGSETDRDSFSIVAVSDTRQSAPVKVVVTIKRLNDETPKIIRKESLQVWEGETIPLTNRLLAVYDEDTLPQYIKYQIAIPRCGFISRINNISHSVLVFSQEDIDRNEVFFTHSGQSQCVIEWTASDGKHSTGIQYTAVMAKSLQLKMVNDAPLYVFPLMHKMISSLNMLAGTNANRLQRPINYIVRRPPALGRLLKLDFDGVLHLTNNFTQRDINGSRIYYQHVKPFHDLSKEDTFFFEVKTPFAETLKNQELKVHVTVGGKEGGELEKYLRLDALRVIEGGETFLSVTNLNLTAVSEFLIDYTGARHAHNLVAKIITPPKHGAIRYRDKKVIAKALIRISDIEQRTITYLHDGSDTILDKIGLNVYLLGTSFSTTDILLYSGPLNISITPVNDQPFNLITDKPQMYVVRGQTTIITKEDLLTVDADNSPDQILYDIMSGPDFGKVFSLNNRSHSLSSFSQQNINENIIAFSHDGSNSSAKFYFQVSDGGHEPKYTAFNIKVIPLKLKIRNHSTIILEQASNVAQIKPAHLSVETNAHKSIIQCNVTKNPQYGKLYMQNEVIEYFTQIDIDKGRVFYVQEKFSANWDSFTVDINIYDRQIKGKVMKIVVKPLLKTEILQASVGGRTRITIANLNATELADKTGSIPYYRITKFPLLGRIKKITKRSKRGTRAVQVKEFTHEDIKNGRIFYVARKIRLKSGDNLQDTVQYILKTHSSKVQPAKGTLKIKLVNSILDDAVEGRRLRPGKVPADKTSSAHPSKPNIDVTVENMTGDYLLIATIIMAVLFISILAAVIVRCSLKRRQSKGKNNGDINNIPNNSMDIDVASLPPPVCTDSRPNSFLTEGFSEIEDTGGNVDIPQPIITHSQTGSIGANISTHLSGSDASWAKDATDLTASVPQCTVTPLGSEPIYKSCRSPCLPPPSLSGYPYGADSEQVEEWGMYETQPIRETNPMLRKNQYWV